MGSLDQAVRMECRRIGQDASGFGAAWLEKQYVASLQRLSGILAGVLNLDCSLFSRLLGIFDGKL